MPDSPRRVQPRLPFIPERFNPWVLTVAQQVLPLVQRARLRSWLPAGIAQVGVVNADQLIELYQQFQAGKIRLLLAFRHVEVDDPLSVLAMFSRILPGLAQQQGMTLRQPLHAHFAYDRGMTLWGGNWLGWLLSRFGGIPVRRGRRMDRIALQAIRDKLLNGTMPMAIAPEGATNGHSERVGPLQPGTAQLGFWCAEDLQKANRSEAVIIVPIGIQYRYITPPWHSLEVLLDQLEADLGLPPDIPPVSPPDPATSCYQRICRLGEQLLLRMEQFYQRYTHQVLPVVSSDATVKADVPVKSELFDTRLQTVLHRSLSVAEHHFGLPDQGTLVDRCRRIEEAGWTDIYREDLPDLTQLSPFDIGLANWIAEAAELQMRHMRLVESFVAVNASYLQEKPSAERLAEMAMLMFDLTARIKGDPVPRRPRLGWRRTQVTVGTPISVSDRWPDYQRDRQSAKQAVNNLTEELHQALQQLVVN